MQGGAVGPPKVPPKLRVKVVTAPSSVSTPVPSSASLIPLAVTSDSSTGSTTSDASTPSSPSLSSSSHENRLSSPSSFSTPCTPSSSLRTSVAAEVTAAANVPPALPYFSGSNPLPSKNIPNPLPSKNKDISNPLPSKNKDIPKPTSIRATQFAKLCAEVVETERTYINALSTMMNIYYFPLVREAACSCFGVEQERVLFGNFPQILELNRTFLEALETSAADSLGLNFLKFIPFMKMYSVYCANFDAATELLEKLLTEDKYMEFQVFAQKCLTKTDGTTLSSYLIMPIQRIPRYKMLLHELVKFSDKASLSGLQRALEEVKTVATVINEQIRARQNQTEIYALTQLFVGEDPQFLKPGRALIRRMDLVKQCRGGPKTFHFILFSDCLVYASSILGKYKLHRKIPIDKSFQVASCPEQGDRTAKVCSSQKSFVVEFPDPDEMREWLEDLLDCMSSCEGKRTSTTQVLAAAAVLKSKNSSQTCKLCQSEFSVFNRAMHCRLCGELCCRDCTKTKVPLNRAKRGKAQEEANESQKLKRICSQCAKTRQAQKRKNLLDKSAQAHAVMYQAFGVDSLDHTGSLGLMCRPVRSSSIVGKGAKRGAEAPTIFDRVDSTHRRLDDLQKHGNVGSKIKKALKLEVKSRPLPIKEAPADLAELQSELEGVVAARKTSFSQPDEQPHLVFHPRLSERMSDAQSEESKLEMQLSPSPSQSPEKFRSPDIRFHIREGTPTTPHSRSNGLPPLSLSASTATPVSAATVGTPRVRQSFTLRPPSRPPPAAPLMKRTPPRPVEESALGSTVPAVPITSNLASAALLASLSNSLLPSTGGFTFSKPAPLTSSFSSPSLFTQPKSPGLTVTRRSPRRSPHNTCTPTSRSSLSTPKAQTSVVSPSSQQIASSPSRLTYCTSPLSALSPGGVSPSPAPSPISSEETVPDDRASAFSDEALAALPTLPRYYFSQHSTLASAPAAPSTPPSRSSDILWELYDFSDEDTEQTPRTTLRSPAPLSSTTMRSPAPPSATTMRSPAPPPASTILRSPAPPPFSTTLRSPAPPPSCTPAGSSSALPLSPSPMILIDDSSTKRTTEFSRLRVPLVSAGSLGPPMQEPPTPPSLEPPMYIPESPLKTMPTYLHSLHAKRALPNF